MTLFTFSTNYDRLINETKRHSIRFNADYWLSRINANPKLDIWWRNPRNKHPDCRKLGIAKGVALPMYGYEFTKKTAKADGYNSLDGLLNVLMELHDLERREVLEHKWATIRWTWEVRYFESMRVATPKPQRTLQDF